MQTLRYLWAKVRHPTSWYKLYGFMWVNTVTGQCGYHFWCKQCKWGARHDKEACDRALLRETLWTSVKGGCLIGGAVAVVYYISWPLFKWLVRMALR